MAEEYTYVWRLEDSGGRGMYGEFRDSSYFYYASMGSGEDDPAPENVHPLPYEDPLLKFAPWNSDYYFGFSSIEQMRRWIYKDEWLSRLAAYGIMLNLYKVPREFCNHGKDQSCFRLSYADMIESHVPDADTY